MAPDLDIYKGQGKKSTRFKAETENQRERTAKYFGTQATFEIEEKRTLDQSSSNLDIKKSIATASMGEMNLSVHLKGQGLRVVMLFIKGFVFSPSRVLPEGKNVCLSLKK